MSICAKCGGVVSPKELYVAWQQLIFNITKTSGVACGNTWIYNWYEFKQTALAAGWDYGDGVELGGDGIKIIKTKGSVSK